MSYSITVFTPTYNRAHTLQRVFNSLMAQTFDHNKFEWILIDDGSSDNTKDLVENFLQKADFKIEYIVQENRGKNYCHNRAISLAKGELFLILDSDDEIVPECMDVFWRYWENLDENLKKDIYGINCLCKDGYTNTLIGHFVQEGLFSDSYRWKHENKVYFEAWGALNTKLFKKHLFPQIDGVKFIPEAYLWDSVGHKRAVLSTNEILRIVYFQDDGFSKNIIKSYKNHAHGRYIYHLMVVNNLYFDLFRYNFLRAIKDMIQLSRMGLHANFSIFKMAKDVRSLSKKFLFLLFLPVGFYLHKRDSRKGVK